MLDLIVDINLLAFNKKVKSADDVIRYVRNLLKLAEFRRDPSVGVCLSHACIAAMCKSGLYPVRTELRSAIEKFNVREFAVDTVLELYDTIMTITPSFEDRFGIFEVKVDEVQFHGVDSRRKQDLVMREALDNLLISIAVLSKYDLYFSASHILFSDSLLASELMVEAELSYIDHSRQDVIPNSSTSETILGKVNTCDDAMDVLSAADAPMILVQSREISDVTLAIKLSLYIHGANSGNTMNWQALDRFSFADTFYDSIRKVCGELDPGFPKRLLRAIVESVNHENLRAVHAIRKKAGGGSKKLKRGKDSAIRRDVDRDIHLHYWDCENGDIEFVSVNHHNEPIRM